jgi:hypothetical protein
MPLPFTPPQVSQRQNDWRGIFSVMVSANTDPELPVRFRSALENANTPSFVRTVAKAAIIACSTGMADLLLTS